MKKFVSFLILTSVYWNNSQSQTFYDISFVSNKGDTVNASHFASKKVLVIILPLSTKDSTYGQLSAFAKQYGNDIQIIGVLSSELGFKKSTGESTRSQYDEYNMIVTEGMRTSKRAKESQAQLMRWLTDQKKNNHYNNEGLEAGTKFFVNESGRLYAVFGSKTSLQNPIIERVMSTSNR